MDSKLRNKWLIILAVLGVCAWWVYPPRQKLVLGPDLAGGTTLLYEVQVPEGADTQETLRRVIEVVSKRVDPDGVRNLVFQAVAGGRIQILMPHPSREVVAKREQYQRLLAEVTESNVAPGELISALRLEGDARRDRLEKLVRGVEPRRALFERAAERYDALVAAENARRQANAEPGSDPDIELAEKVVEAKLAFDTVMQRIEATNIDPVALGHAMELPAKPQLDRQTGQPLPGSSQREQELSKFYSRHTERAEQIQRLVAAYDAYFREKRPLEDPNDLIRLLRGQGVLEFRIAAQLGADQVPDADELRQALRERGPRVLPPDAPLRWYVIDDVEGWLVDTAQSLMRDSRRPRREIVADLRKELESDPGAFFARYESGMIGGTDGKDYYLLLWNTPDRSLTPRQPGWQLTYATVGRDQYGLPAIDFRLNAAGASYFGALTKGNVNRRMAIVLDGRVYSAPNINEPIEGGSGIISGRFSQSDLNYLINTLSAGSLQAQMSQEPIEIRTIQPTLGADNLLRGLKAAWLSLIAVGIFVTAYYFFGGIVANLALLANLVIILGMMAKLQATFTLPGIAGIILNIGMCVDANVLIFERIREELRRGANMLTALRVGHDKAFSAIFDGNLTTLIVCIVLGYFGTAEIKGFGVVLGIGLVANLFTAVFMANTILQTYYRTFPRRTMGSLPRAVPAVEKVLHPRIDWMSKRRVFYTISIIGCTAAIALCLARGEDLFDIEFRSGTEVSFSLREGQSLTHQQVRDSLKATPLEGATVIVVGDTDAGGRATQFSIVTEKIDTDEVSGTIRQSLGEVLDVQPVLSFRGDDVQEVSAAPVYPITESDLGQAIGRNAPHNVSEYRGGVAMVLEEIRPSVTLDSVRERIKSMRLQPEYEQMQFRPFDVIGLESDPANPDRFTSVAIVSHDPSADYFAGEEMWRSTVASTEWNLVRDALTREQSFSKVSRFTPTVARTMVYNAIASLVLSVVAILAYIWFRFGSLRYGLAAVVAMVHDVLIALGLIAASAFIYAALGPNPLLITPFKINMGMIAALLTIIGYSLNDTIVVFDRIRENRGKLAHASPGIINDSVNQTFSRTLLTGMTTLLAILLLYVLGGEAIRGFAMAMFVGIVAGTYSSIALASPLLLIGTGGDPPRGQRAATGTEVKPLTA